MGARISSEVQHLAALQDAQRTSLVLDYYTLHALGETSGISDKRPLQSGSRSGN